MTLRIAVGIATAGRPLVLAATLAELARQTRPPDRLLVCHAAASDIAGLPPRAAEFLPAPVPGLTAQRNRILDAAADCDLLVFFDDDFLPAPDWLERAEALFLRDPAIAAATGAVIADGVRGPGLTPAEARTLLAADRGGSGLHPVTNAYGCNMALRLETLRRHALRFDERLPLYGWFEDVDLTWRLRRHGRVVRDDSLRGVHLGTKHGRTQGRRLGYSQVANPLHLIRTGGCPPGKALAFIARNLAMNLLRTPFPEPWTDRRGRLAGNLLALRDLVRGRLSPGRILDL
jgi:glycosyltransferase involved in cell wall biosynthesis